MNLETRLTIPPEVMARAVARETVILDLASGTYFGLDPVGARVWTLIGEGKRLRDVCDVMMDEFDVARATLENDVLKLAGELVEKKLLAAR